MRPNTKGLSIPPSGISDGQLKVEAKAKPKKHASLAAAADAVLA